MTTAFHMNPAVGHSNAPVRTADKPTSLAAILLAALMMALAGCATSKPVADRDQPYSATSNLAMVAVGLKVLSSDAFLKNPDVFFRPNNRYIRFDRLSDDGNGFSGIRTSTVTNFRTRFKVSSWQGYETFLVEPGRYVLSEAREVKNVHQVKRTYGSLVLNGLGVPRTTQTVKVEAGTHFILTEENGNFSSRSWAVDLPAGQVTVLGTLEATRNWDDGALRLGVRKPDRKVIEEDVLARFKNLTAPVVYADLENFRPDLPKPRYRIF